MPPPPPPPPPLQIKSTEGGVPAVEAVKPVTDQKSDDVFVVVEELPEFPGGGGEAMRSWISDNLKYPGEAFNKKVTGKVDIGFLVTAKGKIKDVTVLKSVHPLLDAEAKRVISSMPDWKPGTQHGKSVPVQMKVQVEFKF
jgi:periplasmic protein TonB